MSTKEIALQEVAEERAKRRQPYYSANLKREMRDDDIGPRFLASLTFDPLEDATWDELRQESEE